MSLYIPKSTNGVSLQYLETNFPNKNSVSTRFNTSIIPASDSTYDLGSTTLRYANIYADNINSSSTSIVVEGSDIGLNLDGVTDDTSLFQDALDAYEEVGRSVQITLNSSNGMALHGLVTVPSNIHLTINCPVYIYGDAGIRTFGNFYEGTGVDMAGADVTTSDNIMDVAAGHGFSSGNVVKIRGRNDDANTGAIEFETNIITNVATNTITFLNDFQNDYQAVFDDQPNFTDKTQVVELSSSTVTTADNTMNRGDSSFTVADGTIFQKGDVVTIRDFVTLETTYTNNTSNNTHRDDINRIAEVAGNVITIETPLSHTYLPTTHTVYIIKIKPVTKTKFENIRIIHKKYPTNRNIHCLGLFNSLNSSIVNCSVINNKRNKTIIINESVGNVFGIVETTGGLTVSYTIPDGDYIHSELTTLLTDNLTSQSVSTGNSLTYTCTYSESTGKITLSATGNFRIPYVAGRAPLICGFMPSDTAYPSGTTFTSERVDLSGNFKLLSTELHFYYLEAAGGAEKDITLSGTIFWSQGTLMKQVAEDMTTNTSNGYTYTITMDDSTDCITFANGSAGNFSIVLTGKTDTVYRYLTLHSAKGEQLSTLSGADNYNSETDMSSVPIRITPTSKGHMFRVDTSLYCLIDSCYAGPSEHVSSGESYCFAVYRCRGNVFTNCIAIQGRHGILFQTAQANQLLNFTDVGARISAIDFHGLSSNDNLVDGAIIIGGISYSPDATTHTAIKIGNTFHVGGDSNNTIRNVKITGYANTNGSVTTYGIYLLPISNNNLIENVDMDGGNIGITITDVTSKSNAEFVINDNTIRNCAFQNIHQPFNLDMKAKSTSACTSTNMIIDNCIFSEIGTGSSDESRARIQDSVDSCIIRNCLFRNIVSGSNDVATLYIKDTDKCHIVNCTFDNVFRGIYSDSVNTDYIIEGCSFVNLTGSSQIVLRDDGDSTGGQYLYNKYITSNPKSNVASLGANIIFKELYQRQKRYISNVAQDTLVSTTLATANSAITTGGSTVMGTTSLGYSSHNVFGVLKVEVVVHLRLPASIGSVGNVNLIIYHDVSGTKVQLGHSTLYYGTSDTLAHQTMTAVGYYNFSNKISSSTDSFLCYIGSTNGIALNIRNSFGQAPWLTVTEIGE